MKPINSLSALVSPTTASSVPEANASQRRQLQQADGQSVVKDSSNMTTTTATTTTPESMDGSSSSMSDKKLLDKRQKESPLSILKVSSLGGLLHPNNKVGSSYQPRDALATYRQQLQASIVLPVADRKVRDSGSLLFMLAFLSFLGYTIWNGLVVHEADINLIVHGHDSYGNICGRNNRPIKLVEKSGQNYTNKPFTKYTLINSQFERYTLDSGRLKNGELYYVREDFLTLKGPDWDAEERTPPGARRERRSSALGDDIGLNYEQLKRNQTLLKSLKSSLMYQYPPLYGYNPREALGATAGPPATISRQQHQNMFNARAEGGDLNEDARQERRQQEQLEQSQTEHRALTSAMYPPTLSPPMTLATKPPTRGGPLTGLVVFDDHFNDSDRFDHMLIKPTLFNTRPKTPDVLNQFEVSSQLLYLTECVDHCPSDHVELIFYRCMPKNWRFSLFPNAINVTRTFIDDILTDMTHCSKELIYIFSFALVLSVALLILLRFLASFIIWSCLALLIGLFLSMASYAWFNYYYQVLDLNTLMPHDSTYTERLALSDKWLVGSIFLTFVAFAIIGSILFMRKRILLVTLLFKESGKAIADMPLLLLQPVLTFAALVTITLLWSVGLICLQSIKVPVIDMQTHFVVFKAETLYKIMKWYHIFAFLWVSHFAIACQHYVIGSAVSKWYFSPNRYNLHSPIGSSVSELILYYLGSVALGSFLVAIFKVVRIVTRQIQHLVQRNCMQPHDSGDPTNGTNPARLNSLSAPSETPSTFCGSCSYVWRTFIWFFDNIVMIINRDAYVEIAIHGHSFLGGAKQAFTVLASNPLRLLAIKSVSNVLLAVAKICVVFGTVSMAIILLEEKTHQLNYSWSPLVISAVYAYIVAHWFLSVYEMVIDALFICYCEDQERLKHLEASNQITESNFMSQILNNSRLY